MRACVRRRLSSVPSERQAVRANLQSAVARRGGTPFTLRDWERERVGYIVKYFPFFSLSCFSILFLLFEVIGRGSASCKRARGRVAARRAWRKGNRRQHSCLPAAAAAGPIPEFNQANSHASFTVSPVSIEAGRKKNAPPPIPPRGVAYVHLLSSLVSFLLLLRFFS